MFSVTSSDALSKDEAVQMLKEMAAGKEQREQHIVTAGYPTYSTAAGAYG